MKKKVGTFIGISMISLGLLNLDALAGSVKKSYINLSKEGNQAQAMDLPSNYNTAITFSQRSIGHDRAKGNDGLIFEAVKDQEGLKFDGINDYVLNMKSVIPKGGSNFTVEVWFKKVGQTGLRELVSQWVYTNTIYQSFYLGFNDDNIRFGDQGYHNVDIGTWTPNEWHHLAAVSTTNNAYIYLDGVLKATKGSPLAYTNNSGPLFFGRQGEINGEYYDGWIKEIRMWDYSRTQDEIKQDMNKVLNGNEKGLTGYWNFR